MDERPGVAVPTRAVVQRKRSIHFVKLPVVAIDHEHVSIAGAAWSTFNWRSGRNRIRTRIALRAERHEVDRHWSLIARDDDVRNTIWRAIPNRAEVRM